MRLGRNRFRIFCLIVMAFFLDFLGEFFLFLVINNNPDSHLFSWKVRSEIKN